MQSFGEMRSLESKWLRFRSTCLSSNSLCWFYEDPEDHRDSFDERSSHSYHMVVL